VIEELSAAGLQVEKIVRLTGQRMIYCVLFGEETEGAAEARERCRDAEGVPPPNRGKARRYARPEGGPKSPYWFLTREDRRRTCERRRRAGHVLLA